MAVRIPYLDGLRGLAAVQVIIGHHVQAFSPRDLDLIGFPADLHVAVPLFFLMSGLVLTRSFERTPNAPGIGFLRRRVR